MGKICRVAAGYVGDCRPNRIVTGQLLRHAKGQHSGAFTTAVPPNDGTAASHLVNVARGARPCIDHYTLVCASRPRREFHAYSSCTTRPRGTTSYSNEGATMKILMVMTSHDKLGNTGRKTGFWLEEFAAPYFTFLDAGATVTVASPKGGQPPLDT